MAARVKETDMRTPRRCLVFFLLLCGSAALSSAQNLLLNGTFDSGISPWKASSSLLTVAAFSNLDADGNAASGSIRATVTSNGRTSFAGLLSECIPVVPGATYQRSYDYLIEPPSGIDVIVFAMINWYDDAACENGSGTGHYFTRETRRMAPGTPAPIPTIRTRLRREHVQPGWLSESACRLASGRAHVVQLTDDTGYLWFFNPDNVEVVVKVLDACEPFGRFWVFAGGLTNVEVDLVVTDSETGQTNTYHNNLNQPFAPLQDTDAFATCP